jgi:hypothetical protein
MHELRKRCPVCSNLIHLVCGCVLEYNERDSNGIMRCMKADSVLVLLVINEPKEEKWY